MYKTTIEIKKIIYEKYNILVHYSDICNHSKNYKRISRKVTYVYDYEDVIAYFSIPKYERKKMTCLKKYGKENASHKSCENYNKEKKEKGLCSLDDFSKIIHKDRNSIYKILEHINIQPILIKNKKFYKKENVNDILKYIEEHPNYGVEFRNESIYKKYGVINASQSEEIKNKKKESCLKNYGVENYMKTDKAKEKFSKIAKDNSESRTIKRNKTLKDNVTRYEIENDCLCTQHINEKYNLGYDNVSKGHLAFIINNSKIPYIIYQNTFFVKNNDIPKLLNYIKLLKECCISSLEKEVCDFIKSIYCGKILENNRHIISPKEIDIYIPNKRVGVEFNGLYYHSNHDKDYHLDKYNKAREQNVRLIQIFEDEWVYKNEICKSIISSSLGIYERKIFARKCEIREISLKEYKDFLNINHIQGELNSKYRFGLYYNNELVQCVGLGESRFKKNEMELHRMATKLNTQVIGGFSKLIKNACISLNVKELYSYVDLRLFNGEGYISSNWEIVSQSKPNYFYLPKGCKFRESRQKYQKHKLKNLLENFDENLSEKENMLNNGYRIIYDCGNLKVKYELK